MTNNLRIAFLTDPSPIRSGPSHYKYPFDIFASIAEAISNSKSAEVYIIATDELIGNCDVRCVKVGGSELGFDQAWPIGWEATWPSSVGSIDPVLFEKCRIFFDSNNIDVLFICDKHDTMREAALAAKVKVIHMAQGPLRSPTARLWLVDPTGIGPDSLCSKIFLDRLSSEEYNSPEMNIISNAIVGFKRKKNNKINIMIALQPHDDIPSMLWNNFGSIKAFILDLLFCAKQRSDINFTLRKHPHDTTNLDDYILNLPGNVVFDDGTKDFWSVVGNFDAVIHLSSTVGSEAALLGLPVLNLGRGLFSAGVERNKYRDAINEFVERISMGDIPTNLDYCIRFSKSMRDFMIDEAYVRLPSFYLALSADLKSSPYSPRAWFEDYGGLSNVKTKLEPLAMMQEIYIMKVESHKRIGDINYLSDMINEMRRDIKTLLDENHNRIVEIETLKAKYKQCEL